MQETLPFTSVCPVRMVGINGAIPFCSIVGDGKLIYTSGCNIILENTKTHDQKILYTQKNNGETHIITHHTTLYNEHLLGMVIKNTNTLRQNVLIVHLNAAIFGQGEKAEVRTHHLRHLEDHETVHSLSFFEEGTIMAVVSSY